MNFNPQQLPPPVIQNENFKKFQENIDVTEMAFEVVSACCFVRSFPGRNGGADYKQEVFEVLLGMVGKDGNLTEYAVTKKYRGGVLDLNGNAGPFPAYLWNVFSVMHAQNPNFMSGAIHAVKYNEPCITYPNMKGLRFAGLIATTNKFNGFNCYSIDLFHPANKATGTEIAQNANIGQGFAQARAYMEKARAEFLKKNTGGFGGQQRSFGYNQQQQAPAPAPASFAPAQGQNYNRPPVGNYQGGYNKPQVMQPQAPQVTPGNDNLPF